MTSVIIRQVDAVGLVVRGDDDPRDVRDVVLSDVFLVNAKHIGRCGGVGLHMVIEGEPIDIPEIPRLAYPKEYALEEAVEPFENGLRRHFMEIPWPDCIFHRFEERVLTNALRPAQYKSVIDLDLGMLNPLSKPSDDVTAILTEHAFDVINPCGGKCGIAASDVRGTVQIQTSDSVPLYPAAVRDKPVVDFDRLTRQPRYLLDGLIFVEPCTSRHVLLIAVGIEYRLAARIN